MQHLLRPLSCICSVLSAADADWQAQRALTVLQTAALLPTVFYKNCCSVTVIMSAQETLI